MKNFFLRLEVILKEGGRFCGKHFIRRKRGEFLPRNFFTNV